MPIVFATFRASASLISRSFVSETSVSSGWPLTGFRAHPRTTSAHRARRRYDRPIAVARDITSDGAPALIARPGAGGVVVPQRGAPTTDRREHTATLRGRRIEIDVDELFETGITSDRFADGQTRSEHVEALEQRARLVAQGLRVESCDSLRDRVGHADHEQHLLGDV